MCISRIHSQIPCQEVWAGAQESAFFYFIYFFFFFLAALGLIVRGLPRAQALELGFQKCPQVILIQIIVKSHSGKKLGLSSWVQDKDDRAKNV